MKRLPAFLASSALIVLLMPSGAQADWLNAQSQLVVRPTPVDGESSAQNPPGFRWARHPAMPARYELELKGPNGQRLNFQSESNWFLPDRPMASGNWTWQVRPGGSSDWSTARAFSLGEDAKPFVVPTSAKLKQTVLAHPRPRGLAVADIRSAIAAGERQTALRRLQERFLQDRALPAVADSDFPMDISGRLDWKKLGQIRQAYSKITRIGHHAESAATLYALTGDTLYFDEARRRAEELAALDPLGVTAHSKDDQTARRIGLSLAVVTDLIGDRLPASTRIAWWKAVGARARAIHEDISQPGHQLAQFPYHSHNGVNLGYLATMASLALGELPEAEKWFDFAVRQHFHDVWPWSDSAGGYANGTAYAQYVVHDGLRLWPILHNATGVNLFAKPWTEGLADFFAWFLPPGTPTHMFGSDAESRPSPWLLKAFASRIGTPVAKWYAANLTGDIEPLLELQAPYPLPINLVAKASPPASAKALPSIGWVAMHSALADRGRSSVYFKSSPFGSYGHSHADQNSFVIHSAGRPLFTDSGVYDWYGSAHFTGWYRRTEAHNAVTYDGGQGQFSRDSAEGSFAAVGRVVSAQLDKSPYRVEGDATPAYGGALTKAHRTLWYWPDKGWIVVRDRIASGSARKFELNFHALVPFSRQQGGYRVDNDGVAACLDWLTPELLETAIVRNAYPVAPDGKSSPAPHALRVGTKGMSTSAELWFGIRIGCAGNPLQRTVSPAGAAHVGDGLTTDDLH